MVEHLVTTSDLGIVSKKIVCSSIRVDLYKTLNDMLNTMTRSSQMG